MAYGKLAEGDRPFDAANNIDASPDDINEIQDQLKAMIGPREINVFHLVDKGGWALTELPTRKVLANTDGLYVYFHLPVYAGQKITEIHTTIEASISGTAGDLELWRRPMTPVAGAMVAAALVTEVDGDMWDGLTNGDATEVDHTGLSYTIAAGHHYFLRAESRTGNCTIHEMAIVAQFGN